MSKKYTVPGGDQRASTQTVVFLALSIVFLALGLFCSAYTGKGSVWIDHVDSGRILLAGQVPDNPTYPIWGYSLLAGLVGDRLAWLQAALAVGVLGWWFRLVQRGTSHRAFGRTNAFAALLALALLPWFAVVTTYFSNSMACILALAGCCALWQAEHSQRATGLLVFAGFAFGLAANIRGEFLLIALLVSFLIFVAEVRAQQRTLSAAIIRSASFMVPFIAVMIPWAAYTHAVTGEVRFSSTNSGGVAYLGLGVLPGNPWNVLPKDEFVDQIAMQSVGSRSAWTLAADQHFKNLYRDAIKQEPLAFLRRIWLGWRLMLLQGMYVPNIRHLLSSTPNDELLLNYAVERVKNSLSLSADHYMLDRIRKENVDASTLELRHFVVVALEVFLRATTTLLLVGLVAALAYQTVKYWPYTFVGWTAIIFVSVLVLVAGLVQTSPRHTTAILPIVLVALLMGGRGLPRVAPVHT